MRIEDDIKKDGAEQCIRLVLTHPSQSPTPQMWDEGVM